MGATPGQPTGPSRLCLSCHDGTVALGAVLQPSGGIDMSVSGGIPSARPSYLGTFLSDDHPVSFSYSDSLPNPELSPTLPPDLLFYGTGTLHCSTCHDPHDNSNKKFLAVDNEFSGLCRKCHVKTGWLGSSHNTSMALWNNMSPNPWPRTGAGTEFHWTTVAQNACENCHATHSAEGPKRLLTCFDADCAPFTEEGTCYACHNGNVASLDVRSQFTKSSRHSVDYAVNVHAPGEDPKLITNHVECADCHNAHGAQNKSTSAPAVSGKTAGVSGVDINGAALSSAVNEYEICFKCHAGSTPLKPLSPGFPIERAVNSVNTRLEFNTLNPSYHPVVSYGKNSDVPSLPSTLAPIEWNLSTSSIIYCTDCHDSDETVTLGGAGPRGPHGSLYSPLLREAYETTDNTAESASNYALCYRCHDRTSILSDISFQRNLTAGRGGHSLHLGPLVNAPCSACHDPHGVVDNGMSGSHTHLINFDITIATTISPNLYPFFTDTGGRSGSCMLVCHGISHSGYSYP